MKFIVMGLGSLGYALSLRLTHLGNDVIGVDNNLSLVEQYKDDLSSTVCLDVSKIHALKSLPISDVDAVIVCLGRDFSLTVEVVALSQNLLAKKVIARSNSEVQTAVLSALGTDKIMNPDLLVSDLYAFEISGKNVDSIYPIGDDINIYICKIPSLFIQHTIEELQLAESNLKLLAVKRSVESKNFFQKKSSKYEVITEIPPAMVVEENDLMVLLGKKNDFLKFYES